MRKKGQAGIQSITPTVLLLVVAAFALVIGLIIIAAVRDSNIVTTSNTETVVNETLTTVTETGENLVAIDAPAVTCATITDIINGSNSIVPSTNFSQQGTGNCQVVFTGNGTFFNNTDWSVTYTYTSGDAAFVDINNTLVGQGTFGDFWEIIVLAIVIGVVLSVLLGAMAFRARRR